MGNKTSQETRPGSLSVGEALQSRAMAVPQADELLPDDFRMSLGEHLDELRRRLIFALLGFVTALVVCLVFGQQTIAIFCKPLIDVLQAADLTPQLYSSDLADAFMVYIRISMISAAALSSPWLLYQLWLFVAAGLYPAERKLVKRYLPLSIGLLIAGMALVYFIVLPWTLSFFIEFSSNVPLPGKLSDTPTVVVADDVPPPVAIPSYDGDPADPPDNSLWFNAVEGRLKFFRDNAVRVITFGPSRLVAPLPDLPRYISMVISMLVIFGLSFQLPLVVAALAKLKIVQVATLKASRKYAYFAIFIVAAVITPGDAFTATIALAVPLTLLYEMGIWLARDAGPKPA